MVAITFLLVFVSLYTKNNNCVKMKPVRLSSWANDALCL